MRRIQMVLHPGLMAQLLGANLGGIWGGWDLGWVVVLLGLGDILGIVLADLVSDCAMRVYYGSPFE